MIKCILFALLVSYSTIVAQIQEFRAVKITNVDSDVMFSDQKIADAMDYLASIGINVILPVVWNGNSAPGTHTLYPSTVMENFFGTEHKIHPGFVGRDPLKRVIIEAHRNGMEVYPWFELGFAPSYSQNGGYILEQFPDWACLDKDANLVVKNGFDWMSAIHPEVQFLIQSLALEVIDNYDVDGIEWSDRIPAMPVEGGYEPYTVELYKQEHDGQVPPDDYNNTAWKEWRADKLSDFLGNVYDSVKARGSYLSFSSSPSVYPWGYENYLQDSDEWIDRGIIDNFIPQLYRYTLSDYIFELNQSLSFIPDGYKEHFFAGILVKSGSYVIEPGFLLNSIKANRDRGVYGDVFFFYEGLRANDDLLGDTLKATYYKEPALNPERGGQIWRPKGNIISEDEDQNEITGSWQNLTAGGIDGNVLYTSGGQEASVSYYFDVETSAWYNVYFNNVTGGNGSENSPVVIHGIDDTVFVNQADFQNSGWQELGTVYLEQGLQKVFTLKNFGVPEGKLVIADGGMLLINRKKSPDVIVSIEKNNIADVIKPDRFILKQNYPNPFNPFTTIEYSVIEATFLKLKVFDTLGREVQVLANKYHSPGIYSLAFDGNKLSSGVYYIRLQSETEFQIRKMLLIK